MASITVEWDSRELSFWRGGKVEKALASALKKAGGDAIRSLKAEANRRVRDRKRFKVSFLNRAMPITFPSGKEIARLAWRMDVSGKPVPVAAFPVRQLKSGVSAQINRGQTKLIRHAFIATLASGHSGVFQRIGKKRLPIREAYTTRVSDVFQDEGFIPELQAKAQSVFLSAFDRLLPLELARIK